MNTILLYEKDWQSQREKAKGNFKENEMTYIIFKNEIDKYVKEFQANQDQAMVDTLMQFHSFNQIHFKLKLDEAVSKLMTANCETLELFDKNPKFAHINLHQSFKLDENLIPKTTKDFNWNFLSLALLKKNTSLFNNLIKNHRPMTGMLFRPREEVFEDEKKWEYKSELQALTEVSEELDVLFNSLENHPSLFTFEEVYYMLKNILSHGTPNALKILHSKTVKSWFIFINNESKRKVIL
jgi:hypothetical protein